MARSERDFTDFQVLTLVRANPGLHIYALLNVAKSELKVGAWTHDKIRNAANRLEGKRIKSEYVIEGGRTCRKLYPI